MFCIVQIVSLNEIFVFNIKGPSQPVCFAGVVAAIFTYIKIAALRVLAISEDFLRYVDELGSGVLRNHYVIKVLYVFVFFLLWSVSGPNVAISSETWKAATE